MASKGVSVDLSSIAKKGHLSTLRDEDEEVPGSPKSAVFNLKGSGTKTNLPKMLQPFARMWEENKVKLPFIGEVRLDVLWALAKKVWAWTVGISLTLLLLTAFGLFDILIPTEIISKETLIEIFNQIVTTGFTMMCLYLHPERCAHAQMVYRWNPSDVQKLREAYSKNGTKKPYEWFHFLIIVILLQLNCIGQYVLMFLNIVYNATDRPPTYVFSWLAIALGCALLAGMYKSYSHLGRDYEVAASDVEKDLEARI
jgi:amino acid transporter